MLTDTGLQAMSCDLHSSYFNTEHVVTTAWHRTSCAGSERQTPPPHSHPSSLTVFTPSNTHQHILVLQRFNCLRHYCLHPNPSPLLAWRWTSLWIFCCSLQVSQFVLLLWRLFVCWVNVFCFSENVVLIWIVIINYIYGTQLVYFICVLFSETAYHIFCFHVTLWS